MNEQAINKQSDSREYEVSFLVRDEADASEVRRLVVQHGGEIVFEGQVKRLTLSYAIEKMAQAYFGYLHARLSAEEVVPFEHDLASSVKVLRALVVKDPYSRERVQAAQRAVKAGGVSPAQHAAPSEPRPSLPLSNEALEKKIEEILQ